MNDILRKLRNLIIYTINGILHFRLIARLARESFAPSFKETFRNSHGDSAVLIDSLKIISRIDKNKFAKIYSQFKDVSPSPGYSKYLDAGSHIARSVYSARRLGLHNSHTMSVLDIGSGAGYFPLACRWYGHQAFALDVGDCEMFNQLIELLEIPHIEHRILAHQPLPRFQQKFDLVTCFQILFDSRPDGSPWTPGEWNFLFQEFGTILMPGGRILLGLNTMNPEHKQVREDNLHFFRELGARVQGSNVLLSFSS